MRPVIARTISSSRPRSLVSVVTPRPPPDLASVLVDVVALDSVELVERLGSSSLVGQPSRRVAHVELAGDDVGDQARAVLAEEVDLATIAAAAASCSIGCSYAARSRPAQARGGTNHVRVLDVSDVDAVANVDPDRSASQLSPHVAVRARSSSGSRWFSSCDRSGQTSWPDCELLDRRRPCCSADADASCDDQIARRGRRARQSTAAHDRVDCRPSALASDRSNA